MLRRGRWPGRRFGGGRGVIARPSLRELQASFYTLESRSNVSLVSGGVQELTDTVAQADKSVPEAPYLVSAPSAAARPTLNAIGGLVCDGVDDILLGLSSALAATMSGPSLTFYTVWQDVAVVQPGAAGFGAFFGAAGDATTNNVFVMDYGGSSNAVRAVEVGSGTLKVASSSDIAGDPNNVSVIAGVLDTAASELRLHFDGVLKSTVTGVVAPTAMDNIFVGAKRYDSANQSHFQGTLLENSACLAAHPTAEVLETSAALKTYWEARGAVFT